MEAPRTPAEALTRRRRALAAVALLAFTALGVSACGVELGDDTALAISTEGGPDVPDEPEEDETTTTEEETTTTEEPTTTTEETTTTTERTTTTRQPTTTTTAPLEVYGEEVVDVPTGITWRMDDVPAPVEGPTLFGPMRSYQSDQAPFTLVMVAQDGGWTFDDFKAQLPAIAPERTDEADRTFGSFRAFRYRIPVPDEAGVLGVMAIDVGGRLVVVAIGVKEDRAVFADLLLDAMGYQFELG